MITRQDAMRLWRKHGGGQHGPRVETATIPLNQFHDFVADIVSIVSAEATEAQARRIEPPKGAIPDQAWSGNRGSYGQMQEAASTLPTLSLEEKIARLICTHFKDPLATLDVPSDAFEYEWFYDWAWERAIIRARAILATASAALLSADTKEPDHV